MEPLKRATALLAQTESALKELLAEAAQQSDYGSVVRIAAWARAIHEMNSATPSGEPSATANLFRRRDLTESGLADIEPKRGPAPRKKEGSSPAFFREDDDLVLLAWSKREKKEYRHKASRMILESLAKAMMDRGSGGRVFATDELFPVRDVTDGAAIPKYKAYVGISFFKHTGLIEQHGRRGYSIPKPKELEESVAKLWQQLPTAE